LGALGDKESRYPRIRSFPRTVSELDQKSKKSDGILVFSNIVDLEHVCSQYQSHVFGRV
jgi:hypothetical protein